jgi:aspartyl-tRNA(Asn)/glutamyl-tRNA(Gln) amidotransferase subunit A
MSNDVAYLSALDALAAFRNRTLSPVEYLDALLAQIDSHEGSVGAVAFRFDDEARDAARRAETVYLSRSAEPRPLEGIPVGIKDEMGVLGQPCTYGSLIYRDHMSTSTAPLAERALAAGAYVHIRTRTPEFSCIGMTHSRLWGVSHNPWNATYDVGGSSGGSAAALASGMTPLAGGSDIGGSIRIPASCCGVVGFKPPYGRVPQEYPFNLDHYCHEGPMARTVADTALFENLIAGAHPVDVASLPKPTDLPLHGGSIAGWRIAVCETLGDYPVHPDMLANLRDVASRLVDAGAVIEYVELPWTRDQIMRASLIHYAAIFGPSVQHSAAEHSDLMTDYALHFAEVTAEVGGMTAILGGLTLEGEIYHALAPVMERNRVLLAPSLAVPALDAGVSYVTERVPVGGEEITMWEHMMTVPFNICSRMPVLNVPSGFADNGVPTGIQVVGRTFDDASVFNVGYAIEQVKPWAGRTPFDRA